MSTDVAAQSMARLRNKGNMKWQCFIISNLPSMAIVICRGIALRWWRSRGHFENKGTRSFEDPHTGAATIEEARRRPIALHAWTWLEASYLVALADMSTRPGARRLAAT
jgi:hypothetical protein